MDPTHVQLWDRVGKEKSGSGGRRGIAERRCAELCSRPTLVQTKAVFRGGGGGYGLTPEIVTNFLLYTCHVVLFIGLSVSIIFAKLFAVN